MHQHRIDIAIEGADLEVSGDSRGASKSSTTSTTGMVNVDANIEEALRARLAPEDVSLPSAFRTPSVQAGYPAWEIDHSTRLTEGLGEEWLVNLDTGNVEDRDREDGLDETLTQLTVQSDLPSLAESEWMSGTSDVGQTHTLDEVRQEIRRMNDCGFIQLHIGPLFQNSRH
jgi:hypothetical protein